MRDKAQDLLKPEEVRKKLIEWLPRGPPEYDAMRKEWQAWHEDYDLPPRETSVGAAL